MMFPTFTMLVLQLLLVSMPAIGENSEKNDPLQELYRRMGQEFERALSEDAPAKDDAIEERQAATTTCITTTEAVVLTTGCSPCPTGLVAALPSASSYPFKKPGVATYDGYAYLKGYYEMTFQKNEQDFLRQYGSKVPSCLKRLKTVRGIEKYSTLLWYSTGDNPACYPLNVITSGTLKDATANTAYGFMNKYGPADKPLCYLNHVWYAGDIISSSAGTTPDACQRLCISNERCQAFTLTLVEGLHHLSINGLTGTKTCYLRGRLGSPEDKVAPGVVNGPKCDCLCP